MPAPAAVNPFEEFADDPFVDAPDVEIEDLEDDAPVFTVMDAPPEEPVPAPVAQPIPVVEDEEEREDLEGGGSYVIKKVNKGAGRKYQAQVTPVEGNVQFYYNDTKQGLLREVLKAQVHATTKIHQQEQRWKNSATVKTGRELTAEEKIHANELYQTDPVAANEFIREIESGVTKADKQAAADQEIFERLDARRMDESRKFVHSNPTFTGNIPNQFQLINWMCEKFLGRRTSAAAAIKAEVPKMTHDEFELTAKDVFTADNLSKAFFALSSRGLLDLEPTPTPPPVAAPAPPRIETPANKQTPTPVSAPVIRRPQRVTGLKPNQGTVDPENSAVPTPADDLDALDSLTDDQLRELTFGKGGFMHRLKNGEN